MVNERYLSPTAKRRREIIADIEMGLAYAAGVLTAVIGWVFLRALGVI